MEIPNLLAGKNIYFFRSHKLSSYDCPGLHSDVIRDRSLQTCRNAILQNKHLFRVISFSLNVVFCIHQTATALDSDDKVVLEVNCGTAILSMFIASTGAKTVIGIEPSSMATVACRNIEENKFTNIHILKKEVDEIDELPFGIDKVDIIVSQWQAYLMFDENLLESLLSARNKWLKTGGLMFPDEIVLHITGADCEFAQKTTSKNVVKSLSFNSLSEVFYRYAKIDYITWQQVMTSSATIRKMNLKKMSIEDFSFSENFILTSLQPMQSSDVNAFFLFFEVCFNKGHKKLKISSSPFEPERIRWKHIIFKFENEFCIYPNDQIKGTFKLSSGGKKNKLNFHVNVDFLGAVSRTHFSKEYIL